MAKDSKAKCDCAAVKKQLIKYHMIIMILVAVIIGVVYPTPGAYMAKTQLSNVCIFLIFIISGLKLNGDQIKKAIHAWPAALSGVIYILFLTPIIGFGILQIPLTPTELITGLACVTCAPTTMASGAILTEQCGGNFGCGLLLSVATNLIGVFVVPFTVSLMFNAAQVSIELDAVKMLVELLVLIALPMVIGFCVSHFIPGVSGFIKKYNTIFKFLSSFFLCLVPWVKMSNSAEKLLSLEIGQFFIVLFLCLATNLLFFFVAWLICKIFRFSFEDMTAVTLCGCGKTLPISLTIVSYLPASMGDQGLLTLPSLVIQFLQLITTSIISGCFGSYNDKRLLKKSNKELGKKEDQSSIKMEESVNTGIELTSTSKPSEITTMNTEEDIIKKSPIDNDENHIHDSNITNNNVTNNNTTTNNSNSKSTVDVSPMRVDSPMGNSINSLPEHNDTVDSDTH
ncbi:hypothetical protein WA158_005332 [Blastocystis sp. Blastoise]